ncbi:MAG: helix-turn-helix transcriptional regulator [Sandaracinaceae bacterium]
MLHALGEVESVPKEQSDGRGGRPRGRPLAPFGQRLRRYIAEAGFRSRSEFLRALGADAATIYRYETGERQPSAEYLVQISDLLGVSVGELLGRDREDDDAPAYPAWDRFLTTEHGRDLSDAERETLASMRFAGSLEPTVETYRLALAGVRMALHGQAKTSGDAD